MKRPSARLGAATKLWLAARIVFWYAVIRLGLRRWRLPELVERLSAAGGGMRSRLEPKRLGRIVSRVLHCGPLRARCLFSSLVLFRLLREEGLEAELVIGLPPQARSHEAHAWVEVRGIVVGPPPGRLGHSELARYGKSALTRSRAASAVMQDPMPCSSTASGLGDHAPDRNA